MYLIKLESAGYEAKGAYDGLDGLRLVKDFSPDLILLDLRMPQMDGFVRGQRVALEEGRKGTLTELPDLPKDLDPETTAAYIRDVPSSIMARRFHPSWSR